MVYLFFSFLLSVQSFAFPRTNEICVQTPGDFYEPALQVMQGEYKGQCLDTSTVRPPVFLKENPDSVEYANFFMNKKWWIATVPKNGVAKVYYQIVPFEIEIPLIQAAHTQFRFLLKNDQKIILRLQRDNLTGNKTMDDVIISSTYTAPKGQKYNALKGFGGTYGIVTRALYSADRAEEEILKDKSTVHQYELKMTEQEKNKLFMLVLQQAAEVGYKANYDLLNNNCATIAFDNLDRLRPPPQGVPPMRGSLLNILDEFIKPSLKALISRKWLDPNPKEIAPMNTEMMCYPATQTCIKKR